MNYLRSKFTTLKTLVNVRQSIPFRCNSTHFGFETVDEEEKQKKVFHVFENVAQKYDLMNDTMSVGIHRLWKDNFVRSIMPTTNLQCLDVAGGTGDIAFRINRFSKPVTSDGPISPAITLCDINPSMIEVGKERATKLGIDNITWTVGDAESLPFDDQSFDLYTIAFGIRNCTHIDKVLEEAFRVLKCNGRFFCLEFSQVTNPVFRKIYDAYSMQMIPVMGQIIAGDWDSYRYLVESIRQFPPQSEFAEMIRSAGFSNVRFTNYSLGICAVHSGIKRSDTPVDKSPPTDSSIPSGSSSN